MRNIAIGLVIAMLLAAPAAAQFVDLEEEPGAVLPDNPLYGLDVWADNLFLDWNVTTVGTVAEERAAEAWAMYDADKPNATQRAIDELQVLLEEREVPEAEREAVGRAVAMAAEIKVRTGIDTVLEGLGMN